MCPSVRWSCLIISVTVGQHSFSSTWPETCFLCSVITAKDLRTSLNSKCVFIFKSFFLCVTSTGCVQVVLDFFFTVIWFNIIFTFYITSGAAVSSVASQQEDHGLCFWWGWGLSMWGLPVFVCFPSMNRSVASHPGLPHPWDLHFRQWSGLQLLNTIVFSLWPLISQSKPSF